jgi:hypothetical protein
VTLANGGGPNAVADGAGLTGIDPSDEEPAAVDRSLDRHRALWAVGAGVASRLLAAVSAFVATYWLGERFGIPAIAENERLAFAREPLVFVLNAWSHWDGGWFLQIAKHGYDSWRAAFFPLYPLLISLVSAAVRNYALAGILVSLACYAGALTLLYRLIKAELGSRVALWSVAFLSFAPTAFFFQAVYSESLFLLTTVASFAFARRGRWLAAGLMALLATLTRSAGLLLVVPLAWLWLEQRRGKPLALPGSASSAGASAQARPRAYSIACLALAPAGLLIYMGYTWATFHDVLMFVTAERHWHRTLAPPTSAVVDGARAAAHSLHTIAARPDNFIDLARLSFPDQWLTLGNLTPFLALLVGLALLVVCWRRLPASYTLYALAALALPLCYPTRSVPLLSLPRFLLVDFPLFVALAAVLERRPILRWALLVCMLVSMVGLTAMFANDMWVA